MALYKFITYIPDGHLQVVKEALFDAGAGRYENYDCCSWQVLGVGQFRPLSGANPAIGQLGQIEQVDEWRVEMIVEKQHIRAVLDAYRSAHPYEVPAYDLFAMVDESMI